MMNAVTYLTRRCPQKCTYCKIRDSKLTRPDLDSKGWIEAFSILHKLGVDFNLILGNETWLLEDSLLPIMEKNRIPYALYTTCPDPWFKKYRDTFFSSGFIDNLSCGVDYPLSYLKSKLSNSGRFDNDMEVKSYNAWKGFAYVKEKYPDIDTHGTMTVNATNYLFLPDVINELSALGVFSAFNFIHWDIDEGFDFFPSREKIKDLVIQKEMYEDLREALRVTSENPGLLQNPQMLGIDFRELLEMGWHCKGDPYGGPTIDADGSCRCCGYRKGTRTPKFNIFDLVEPSRLEEWKEAVRLDALDCPGCSWGYAWQYKYWQSEESFGKVVFQRHAGKHIDEKYWATRRTV